MQPTNSTKSTANREIAALVSRLLGHYWTADDPPQARQAQIEDWLEDLREFGPAIVADACREWRRRDDNRRPTPGQIRAMCNEVRAAAETRQRLASSKPGWSDAEFLAAADVWAKDNRYSCWVDAEAAGLTLVVMAPNGEKRRFGHGRGGINSDANFERLRQLRAELAGRKAAAPPAFDVAKSLGVEARELDEAAE